MEDKIVVDQTFRFDKGNGGAEARILFEIPLPRIKQDPGDIKELYTHFVTALLRIVAAASCNDGITTIKNIAMGMLLAAEIESAGIEERYRNNN